jgi:hypothetical protein
MAISGLLVLVILGQPAPVAVRAEPPGSGQKAAAQSSTNGKNEAIFKVVVWYHRDRPLATFQYQEYDLRKGEYTSAVDAWVVKVRKDYPKYVVIARDVYATLKPGQTERLKVGSVIRDELTVAAAMSGVVIGVSPGSRPGPIGVVSPVQRPSAAIAPGGSDRSFLDRPETTFPVPVPYPRPHP